MRPGIACSLAHLDSAFAARQTARLGATLDLLSTNTVIVSPSSSTLGAWRTSPSVRQGENNNQ